MKNKEKIASLLTESFTDEEWEIQKNRSLIAAEIELARIEMGKSQKEFAKFMNVTQGMISRWESGTYNFTIETLSRIAFRLGRSIESFFSTAVSSSARIENFEEIYQRLSKRNQCSPKRKAPVFSGSAFSTDFNNAEVSSIA